MVAEQIDKDRFLDTCVAAIAYDAYQMALSENAKVDPRRRKDLDRRAQASLVRRWIAELTEGVEKFLLPVLETKPELGVVENKMRMALHRGSPDDVFLHLGKAIQHAFDLLGNRPALFRELFSTGKQWRLASTLDSIARESSPASRLNKLAGVTFASGPMAVLKKWLQEAAELVGAPLSPLEQVMSDVSQASDIATKLGVVKVALENTDPNTPQAADLALEKTVLMEALEEISDNSMAPDTVLSAAIATMGKTQGTHRTATGKRLELNALQEDAMLANGKTIIAAGAGSGKTRVLAAKVVYHIQEEGIPASSILASSFTRKSAGELTRRIQSYGAQIEKDAIGNFGTSHSIAGRILNSTGPRGFQREYIGRKDGWIEGVLIKLAMAQAKMRAFRAKEVPPPTGMFANIFETGAPHRMGNPNQARTPGTVSKEPVNQGSFHDAIRDAWMRAPASKLSTYLKSFVANSAPGGTWYNQVKNATHDYASAGGLSLPQKKIFQEVFDKLGIEFSVYGDMAKANTSPDSEDVESLAKTASANPGGKKSVRGISNRKFANEPANEWFNMGRSLETVDSKGNVKPIPAGEFKTYISLKKGQAVSPTEAYHEDGSDHAVVYAAYEWLKGPHGEPEFQNMGDMSDILIDFVGALIGNAHFRESLQRRYKIILVDEAQDNSKVQSYMFGLMAGHLDPQTLQPKPDGSMTANTYALIGDDKQCVHEDTLISTPEGAVKARDLTEGQQVLSLRNGAVVPQVVRRVVKSGWERGVHVTLSSGTELVMSPNHRLWATLPFVSDTSTVVYLMYRKDLGFRVGVTGKTGAKRGDAFFGSRATQEKADRMWCLEVCPTREDALERELYYSLAYGVPTMVYKTRNKAELSEGRISRIFSTFGANGTKLLAAKDLSFDHPHWMAGSYSKHGLDKRTVHLTAHTKSGTQVAVEWNTPAHDTQFEHVKGFAIGKNRRLRKYFANYREGLEFSARCAGILGAQVQHRISLLGELLSEITASGLHAGSKVVVQTSTGLELESVVEVRPFDGGSYIDLDVEDASNFFANGVLTHNSIYEFRGATPDVFIGMSDTRGGEFQTKFLDTNFRSGREIVEAAGRLVARNKKQIPMVCKAHREGGRIVAKAMGDSEEAAQYIAITIEGMKADPGLDIPNYKHFGVAVRSNAEAQMYCLELLKRGIPFKSNANFFKDPLTKSVLAWLTIVEVGTTGDASKANAAIEAALKYPTSMMGQKFKDLLTEWGRGNYIRWLLEGGGDRVILSKVFGPYRETVQAFIDNLHLATTMGGHPGEVLEQILNLVGVDGYTIVEALVDDLKNDDVKMTELALARGDALDDETVKEEAMAPLKPLISVLNGYGSLTPAMAYLNQLAKANEKLSGTTQDSEEEELRDAVTVSTMHQWKGLEVPHMFIPMVGGRFPRFNADEDAMASERRLAYVAITRAEERCTVLDIPDGKTGEHSQFIAEACIPYEGMEDKATSSETVDSGDVDPNYDEEEAPF